MTLQNVILAGLLASVFLSVLATGLRAAPQDATHLFRDPGKLLRFLLAVNVVMPLFAVLLVLNFKLDPEIKMTLVVLAVSPIPLVLPARLLNEGGRRSYSTGLLITSALLSTITVPLTTLILSSVFNLPSQASPVASIPFVLIASLIPIFLGMVVHDLAPVFAGRIAGVVAKVGTGVLLATMAVVFINTSSALLSLVANGTVIALVLFVVVALAVGHLFGGPDREERAALAVSTASRHPAIALVFAAANFPDIKLASTAVLLYLLVDVIAALPYIAWTKFRLKQTGAVNESM